MVASTPILFTFLCMIKLGHEWNPAIACWRAPHTEKRKDGLNDICQLKHVHCIWLFSTTFNPTFVYSSDMRFTGYI
jgi:hypothetical protein